MKKVYYFIISIITTIILFLIGLTLASCNKQDISTSDEPSNSDKLEDEIQVDNFVYKKDYHGNYYLSSYKGSEENLIISSAFEYDGKSYNIIDIGARAIFDNDAIKNVKIEEGIKRIYDFNFCECANIENITFPNSLEMLGENVLVGTKIKTLFLPDSDLRTADSTFQCNNYLETVYLGKSKCSVASFLGCNNLKNLYISSSVNSKDNTFENIMPLRGITSKVLTNVVIEGDGNFRFLNNTLYFRDEIIFTTNIET